MHSRFRGDIMYNAEIDVHLPAITVSDTLEFAARACVPLVIPGGFISKQFARILCDIMMAMFRISYTVSSKVGDDYIRGVSGGKCKCISIAEAALVRAKLQCWDNSTRGLDSNNAISFCETLRVQANIMDIVAVVAIYQAPQSAYDVQLYLWCSWKYLVANPGFIVAQLIFNLIIGFILGSIFYNLALDTSSFYYYSSLIFFTILFNIFISKLKTVTYIAHYDVLIHSIIHLMPRTYPIPIG
ncbi:hypothetical protein AUP68_02386 [Ilyonectria robusta]